MTILVIIGYWTFANIIFYVLTFIIFCPCICYLFLKDIYNGYVKAQRAKKIQEKIKETKTDKKEER